MPNLEVFDEYGRLQVKDNRLAVINSGVPMDRGYAESITTTNVPSTATWTDITGAVVNFNSGGGDLIVFVSGSGFYTTNSTSQNTRTRVELDSSVYEYNVQHYDILATASRTIQNFTGFVRFESVAAGIHTIKFQAKVLAGSSIDFSSDAERPTKVQVFEIADENILPQEFRQSALYRNPVDVAVETDSSGYVAMPYQPLFSAYVSADITNVTGDGTNYVIVYDAELEDVGSNFNVTTGEFTAPVDGYYLLTATVRLEGLGAYTANIIDIQADSVLYRLAYQDTDNVVSSNLYVFNVSCIVPMDAASVARVRAYVAGGAKTVTVGGLTGATGTKFTTFQGFLLTRT